MRYLTEEEVITINYLVIENYSPKEPKGIIDANLLNSSLARPRQTVFGEDAYPDVFSKAAALFESLAKNHCFYNGNKRTAFVSLLQFLAYNGYRFKMEPKKAEDFVVDVVNHHYHFDEIVKIIRKQTIKAQNKNS